MDGERKAEQTAPDFMVCSCPVRRLLALAVLVVAGLWSASRFAVALPSLRPVPIQQVQVTDDFWLPKRAEWQAVTIPDCFAKFEKDGALTNFDKVRDGMGGAHGGPPWYDGLIYEMIRASADFLAAKPDPKLEAQLDGYIDRIAAAADQDPDGYLNTYTQLAEPAHRWGLNGGDDNRQHDVYNAGALIEAGVHYYRATGRTRLLNVAVRLANHMTDLMGPPPKKNIVPGHSLGEEALVNLHQLFREQPALKTKLTVPVTEQRYLDLAEFWLENRGHHEGRRSYGSYGQDQAPLLEQTTIEGHAVRATLLCAGLAAAAKVSGRADYLTTAQRLWENMVQRRMYVTGGLGAVAGHEGFGPDYDLPNNGYLETCAAVGAGFFHENLNLATVDARYADELERVLFNSVLCGVSLKGDTYFYENPLVADGQRERWAWHSCPCCPPMFLKIMGALPGYLYAQTDHDLYVNLFVGSRATVTLDGVKVGLRQTTRYPWDGNIQFAVEPERATNFTLNLRLPGWCDHPLLRVNGRPWEIGQPVRGYAPVRRRWQRGDTVALSLPMPVRRVKANPRVTADVGRVALQRGPVVYCLEAADNRGHLRNLAIPPSAALHAEYRPDLLGGVMIIEGSAQAAQRVNWPETLYAPAESISSVSNVVFTAIPYYANANRQPGEMQVWMPENVTLAEPLAVPTLASRAQPSASYCGGGDSMFALNDQRDPATSDDASIPRFTWWDHRGSKEWVQYDFDQPTTISGVEVYWWDERRIHAQCRVPQSWRLLTLTNGAWWPVQSATPYACRMDAFNRVTFAPVATKALRLEVQLQPDWSGGILEWRVE